MRQDPTKEAHPVIGERAMRLWVAIARRLPQRMGYWLAERAGRLSGRLFPERRAILESNLAPVLETDDPRRLRKVALEIFGHAMRSYYELLRLPTLPSDVPLAMVVNEEPGWTQVLEAYQQGKGMVLIGTHQSSFDMAGHTLVLRGLPLAVFTLPDEAGFGSLNELRQIGGAEVLPAGPPAVRQALRLLRRGEVLVMAGDRAIKGQGTVVEFFGRPTLLPDGHVRLALRTGAPVFCAFVHREGGEYRLRFQSVEMVHSGDGETDVRESVQRVARAMEPAIRAHAEQWHLFRRLWE